MDNDPTTERQTAPVTPPPAAPAPQVVMPRQKHVERQGSKSQPYVHHHPQVRGGVCDWCGILDPNVAAEHQYKLCPHFRGMLLRCSYCDENKNPDDVAYHAVLNITDSPTDPNALVVVCDSYECSRRHQARFQING